MTLVVHVVGLADLGIDQPKFCEKEIPTAVASSFTTLSSQLRLSQIATPSEDELWNAVFQSSFPTAKKLEDLVSFAAKTSEETPPLTKIFENAQQAGDDSISLLLVGCKGGHTPTDALAHALHSVLRALSTRISKAYGCSLELPDPLIFPSLQETDNIESAQRTLEAIAQETPDSVARLVFGGGATSLLLTCAAALEATYRGKWSILPLKEDAQTLVELMNKQASIEQTQWGWLMGLGFPTIAAKLFPEDQTIQEAVNKIEIALGEKSPETPSNAEEELADALAFLSLLDVSRGDLAGGMSIRAWIEAEYQRRRKECGSQSNLFDSKLFLGKVIGEAQGVVQSTGDSALACDQWLADRSQLNQLAANATHSFKSIAEGSSSQENLFTELLSTVRIPRPTWLSWPSPAVCFLYAEGIRRQPTGSHQTTTNPSDKGRLPFPLQILKTPIDHDVDVAVGHPATKRLHVFSATTPESHPYALETRDSVDSLKTAPSTQSTWDLPATTFTMHDYRTPATAQHKPLQDLHGRVDCWLRTHEPRCIIVGASGPKEVVMTLLMAAQKYGALHAVPVFLASTVSYNESKQSEFTIQFHRFGLSSLSHQTLIEAANYCMDRFDFYTVARILASGDSKMHQLAPKAYTLATGLTRAVNALNPNDEASVIVDVMDIVKELFVTDRISIEAQHRLAVIIGELMPSNAHRTSPLSNNQSPTDIHGRLVDLDASQLVTLLREVRNRLPITHGTLSFSDVLANVREHGGRDQKVRRSPLEFPEGKEPSYKVLLECAIDKIRAHPEASRFHANTPNSWYQQYQDLRSAIDQMRQEASTPSVEL